MEPARFLDLAEMKYIQDGAIRWFELTGKTTLTDAEQKELARVKSFLSVNAMTHPESQINRKTEDFRGVVASLLKWSKSRIDAIESS